MLQLIRIHWFKVSAALLAAALVGAGGAKLYVEYNSDCCQAGASCCHPGSPCCQGGHHVAQR